jgi:hypothetical protein
MPLGAVAATVGAGIGLFLGLPALYYGVTGRTDFPDSLEVLVARTIAGCYDLIRGRGNAQAPAAFGAVIPEAKPAAAIAAPVAPVAPVNNIQDTMEEKIQPRVR